MALYVNGTKMSGALASDPTSNNTEGDQYFNTVENAYKISKYRQMWRKKKKKD